MAGFLAKMYWYPLQQHLWVHLFAVKVCTLLSMPPDDEVAVADRGASIRAAAAVREAFTVPDALGVVVGLMEAPLAAGRRVQEQGIAAVQLVLALMRNLLSLHTDAGNSGGEGPGLRARLLFARRCFEEGVVDVVLLAIHMAQEVGSRAV